MAKGAEKPATTVEPKDAPTCASCFAAPLGPQLDTVSASCRALEDNCRTLSTSSHCFASCCPLPDHAQDHRKNRRKRHKSKQPASRHYQPCTRILLILLGEGLGEKAKGLHPDSREISKLLASDKPATKLSASPSRSLAPSQWLRSSAATKSRAQHTPCEMSSPSATTRAPQLKGLDLRVQPYDDFHEPLLGAGEDRRENVSLDVGRRLHGSDIQTNRAR